MPTDIERRMAEILAALAPMQAQMLLEFAEFLCTRYATSSDNIAEPIDIARPAQESVVGAIKRLRKTYPMLDPAKLLPETSALMSAHVTQGRGTVEVIEELQNLFRRHYDELQRAKATSANRRLE